MLNFSSFMHLAYEFRQKAEYDLYPYLSDFLVCLLENTSGTNIYEKPYLSNLYNGEREFPQKLKDALGKTKNEQNRCYAGMKKWLKNEISLLQIEDYKAKLHQLIANDETISEKQGDMLKSWLTNDDFAQALTKVFLYAIRKENVVWKDSINKDEIEYLLENDKRCPLCCKNLFINRKKKTIYKYGIVYIYPLHISPTLEQAFNEIKPKPNDTEAKQNKICLCLDCANEYESMPTTRIYSSLISKKREISTKNNVREKIDDVQLDQQIDTIIFSLKNIPPSEDLNELRMIPLQLKEKIYNNDILRDKINDDVNKYYYYVRKNFSLIDGGNSEFKVIANSINTCYLKLQQMEMEQEEIYYKIVDWVLRKLELSDKYRTACQIVVSFFVQNCEVFDEITK